MVSETFALRIHCIDGQSDGNVRKIKYFENPSMVSDTNSVHVTFDLSL